MVPGPRSPDAFAAAATIPLPLVGRAAEVDMLHRMLRDAEAGSGRTLFLAGEGGVGKTRLAQAAAEWAKERGWAIASGRAYPVETGVPYAAFSDAMLPLFRTLDAATLTLLSRGGNAELASLFPGMLLSQPVSQPAPHAAPRGDPTELKTRLIWNFTQFLSRFADKQPLLIVLENLHWADVSSLELLHFVARQIGGMRVTLLCTYNALERDENAALRAAEQSLLSAGAARVHELRPLTRAAVDELLEKAFGASDASAREFAALLYGWTRGNPFFVDETLKALIDAGRLEQRGGAWSGWQTRELELPPSVRDAIASRVERLSADARQVADLVAVIGTRASLDVLRSVSALDERALLDALDELRGRHILVEGEERGGVIYDFAHPLVRDTLYGALGLARARSLHAAVAEALEAHYAARADEHADELAFHFARAGARDQLGKASRYLATAGRSALAKYANREAATYLAAALEHMEGGAAIGSTSHPNRSPEDFPATCMALIEDLARARQRLGDYDAAAALWERAREDARAADDAARLAVLERRMGLASYWRGKHADALAHYDAGLSAAQRVGDDVLVARIRVAKGVCLVELGRPAEGEREVQRALDTAERRGDDGLAARAHRALLLLHAWTGSPARAREHGARAIALARGSDERTIAWSAHWALALLGGLTGHADETTRHIADAERIAEELRSPVLRMWTAEISIEYLSATGAWDAALELAERTIAVARALSQRALLPRLLVWTGILYLGRGDLARGRAYIDEAWELSGAGRAGHDAVDVHTVVPAHTGRAAYHLAVREFDEAIRVGEAGLAIADQSGYVVWGIYRLLPVVAEACLWRADLERARWIGDRLRRDSERVAHPLGLAWADACDALVATLSGDAARAVHLLRDAATALEAVPFVADAARLRRDLASRLAELGDRDGALRELRRAHDVFAALGAEGELDATREAMRALGARPPSRSAGEGAAGLTGRELDIVRLVAGRKSNKEIGAALRISPRTVSTHLSNIFAKLAVESRGELTDWARAEGLT